MTKKNAPAKLAPRHTQETTETVLDDRLSPSAGRARLVQTAGGEMEPIILPNHEFTVGSSVDCDLFVDHPTVSRQHFSIRRDGLAFMVRDLKSTNGTFVNGVRIKEVYLQAGASIQAGKVTFCFEMLAA
jgi:predicted component of type VI protein secretion system